MIGTADRITAAVRLTDRAGARGPRVAAHTAGQPPLFVMAAASTDTPPTPSPPT